MKKLINKLFGVNVYATSKNVQGKKSNGSEDVSWEKNWRLKYNDQSGESLN